MDTKQVIVNFRHISAYKALENIIEQCGTAQVIVSIGGIISEGNIQDTLMGYPVYKSEDIDDSPVTFGSFNEYGLPGFNKSK